MEIISVAEARAGGLKQYFTGKPCMYGHLAMRHVSSRNCCECLEIRAKAKYECYRSSDATRKREVLYGHPDAYFHQMLADQGGGCASCGRDISFTIVSGKQTTANIDHCHSTNIVRGVLCKRCNTAIGFLGDNIAGIQRALAYLQRAEQPHPKDTQDQPLTAIKGFVPHLSLGETI